MKKMITMLLLTTLCMTVFASCDLGNGLVSELLEELKQGAILEELPVQDWETVYVDDITLSTSTLPPIETMPPVEYETEVDSIVDEWTEVDSWDEPITEPAVDVVYPLEIVLDGDLSDWHDVICAPKLFYKDNLDAWVGEVDDENGFAMRMAADHNYVYFAFDITDYDITYAKDGAYQGDAFQIQIDFGGWAGETEAYERAIFYSFAIQEDNTVDMTVQCISDDAASTIDYQMASDDDPEWREGEVIGCTCKKPDGSGWIAEYAISWETLYRDIVMKLEADGIAVPSIALGYDNVDLRMLVCYLDYQPDGSITGAWGTPNQMGSLVNGYGWYPENAGVTVQLYPAEGRGDIEYAFQ